MMYDSSQERRYTEVCVLENLCLLQKFPAKLPKSIEDSFTSLNF